MPDLIVHIAFALLISVLFKITNWKLVITGAILPDISRILITVLNVLKFDEVKTFLLIEPLHTPFITLLIILSLSFLFKDRFKSFFLIYFGALSHFLLDLMQFSGNFGQILFYPFYIKEFTLNIFYGGNIISPIVGTMILIISSFYLKQNKLEFNSNYFLALIPLVIVLAAIVSTQNLLLEKNIHGVNFILNPEKYENKNVHLYDSKVISLNPAKINEMNHIFKIETKKEIKLNSGITISGTYKQNKIYVDSIFYNNNNKYIFSLIGLLIYAYLIVKKD